MTQPEDPDAPTHVIDPDNSDFDADDPRIIDGEAREVVDDSDGTNSDRRRVSRGLVLAVAGIILAIAAVILLARSCGGDSHSDDGSDTPTADTATATQRPTESATIAATATQTSTPKPAATSTPTSVITPNPSVTVLADTGDPLGLTGGGSGQNLWLLALVGAVLFCCAWTFWKQTGPSRPQT